MSNKYLDIAIEKVVKQEVNEVLDKIRAKIEELPKTYPFVDHINTYVKEDDVLQIIDKYKAESEDKQDESSKIQSTC